MNSKDRLLKFLAGAVAVIIVGFFCLKIFELTSKSLETQTVYEQTVLDTVDAEMYVIRDETLLSDEDSGVIVPIASNGERVSRGSEIAAVFISEAQAENYVKIKSLNEKLESYQKVDSQLRLANLDIDKLSAEIRADFLSILNSAYENDFDNLSEDELSFSEKLSRKQISLSESVDCSEKIASLQSQISALQSAANPSRIIASEVSGYYVSQLDGFENNLSSADIDNLSYAQLEVAYDAEKKETPQNSLGKIISGYNWYIACKVDTAKLSGFKEGSKINLILGDSSENLVQTELYKMITIDVTSSIAVFRCNLMNDSLATMRKLNGKIVLDEMTGLKVRKDAVRVDKEGNSYVYVRRGNIVNTRSINVIYNDNDFILAVKPDEGSEIKLPYTHVRLYDEVIISGREIYDGMVIG